MSVSEPSTTDEDTATALTSDFSQTAQALFSAGDVRATLDHVVALAVATIEGCDCAGVFLVQEDVVTTPVSTDPAVADLNSLQHRTREGPCLDAVAQGATVYAVDLDDEPRWPRFGPEATRRGIRSNLALPLLSNDTLGALSLYSRYPLAFGVIDRARGLLLAGLTTIAFSSAMAHEDEERRLATLHGALATRELIGEAQGILMERERITGDEAFAVLVRASQHLNIKLRDVAQRLVETGEKPDTNQRRG
jgi:hypothetical protein